MTVDGSELERLEGAVVEVRRFKVSRMSVVEEQVAIAHALIGQVMSQADHAPRGSNIALRCWEIRNELEDFGAGDDPDVLVAPADHAAERPMMGELLEDALDALEAIPDPVFPPGLGVVVPMIVAVQLRLPQLEEAAGGDDR